jgi:hypothetical protein
VLRDVELASANHGRARQPHHQRRHTMECATVCTRHHL